MKKPILVLLTLVYVLSCALLFTGFAADSGGKVNQLPELKRPQPTDYKKAQAYKEENQISPELLKSVNGFSWTTAKVVLNGKTDNSMYSPLSLYIPLSLAATGANGETYSEMAAVLGMGQDTAKFSEDMGKLYRRSYFNTKYAKLKIANSLWFQDGIKFRKSFLTNATNNYYSTIYKVDFNNKSAARQMSDWVYENTNKLIKPKLELSPSIKLVIMNTIYYKDSWVMPFSEDNTKPQTFYLNGGKTVTCDFMSSECGGAPYFETGQFTATSLALTSGARMHLLLPKKGVSIDAILSNPSTFTDISNGTSRKYATVNLKLPKFSFSTSHNDIIENLQSLGIKKAFDVGADLSKTSSALLYISDIKQDTTITVDEKGIEAAAFTIIGEGGGALEETMRVDLVLDRPFLFIITSDFGAPLFIGVCNNPLAE